MSILLNPTHSEPRQRLQRSASLVSFRKPTPGFTLGGPVNEEPEEEEEAEQVQANDEPTSSFSDGVTPNGKKSKWRASLKGALSSLKQQHETHNRRASAPAALATYAEQRERERREMVDAETERAAAAARGDRNRPALVRFMAVDQDISARLAAMHAAETNAARAKFQTSHPNEPFVQRSPPPRSPLKKFFTSAAPKLVSRWKKSSTADPSSKDLHHDEDMEMILLHENLKATQSNKKIIESKVKAVNASSELTQKEAIWQEYRHRVMADNFIF